MWSPPVCSTTPTSGWCPCCLSGRSVVCSLSLSASEPAPRPHALTASSWLCCRDALMQTLRTRLSRPVLLTQRLSGRPWSRSEGQSQSVKLQRRRTHQNLKLNILNRLNTMRQLDLRRRRGGSGRGRKTRHWSLFVHLHRDVWKCLSK